MSFSADFFKMLNNDGIEILLPDTSDTQMDTFEKASENFSLPFSNDANLEIYQGDE